MEDEEFLQLFQQAANYLRESTVESILRNDAEYQEICQKEERAEKQYLEMALDQEQRQIIDELLLQKERSCLIYADAAYMAGIKNVIQLHRLLNL